MVAPGFTYNVVTSGTGDVTRTIEATPIGDGVLLVGDGVSGFGPINSNNWPDSPSVDDLDATSALTRWMYGEDDDDWSSDLIENTPLQRVTSVDAELSTEETEQLAWSTRRDMLFGSGYFPFAVDPPSELNSWYYPSVDSLLIFSGLAPYAHVQPSHGSWVANVPGNHYLTNAGLLSVGKQWNHPDLGLLHVTNSNLASGTENVFTQDGSRVFVHDGLISGDGDGRWWAHHGLPPNVEISGHHSVSTDEGEPDPPEVVLTLEQWHVDNNDPLASSPDSSTEVDRQDMVLVDSQPGFGSFVTYFFELSPTNAADVGTLDADTNRYRYVVSATEGSAFRWHKIPCLVPVFSTQSHVIDASLPECQGWIRELS